MRRGLAAVAALVVACTFPEKHPDSVDAVALDAPGDAPPMIDAPIDATPVDAAVDGPAIDAPVVDAPEIDASVIDASVIDASVIDGPPTCPPCAANARCVIDGGNAECRCNWGYSGDGSSCALAIDNNIVTVSDGRTTTIGSASSIHVAVYLRGEGGVAYSDGDVWFTEGTTSCSGNWDLRTVKFTPGATGPTNPTWACEAEPDDPLVTTIAGTTQRAVCFLTYGPPAIPRCGTLSGGPGTFTQTIDLGGMRNGTHMASSPTGFAFATTTIDGASNPLGGYLARMNAAGALLGTPLSRGAVGEEVLELGRYTERWTLFRAATGGPVHVDVVDDSGAVTDTVSMAALPAPVTRRVFVTGEGESTQRFVYARDSDLFFGELNALGQGSAKRFATTSALARGTFLPMFGGYGVVHSTDTAVYYLRVNASGQVIEAQRTIATGAKVQLIGAAFDGNALWVVYATVPTTTSEMWTVYVLRIA